MIFYKKYVIIYIQNKKEIKIREVNDRSFNKQMCLFGAIVWIILIIVSIFSWANGDTPSWMLVLIPSFVCVFFYIDAFLKIK